MDEIIISQNWGGLGDNLQFSTLPESFFNMGKKVFISSSNKCRNEEIFELVWRSNPFISGISNLPENAGQCLESEYMNLSNIPYFMHRWERAHGLPAKNLFPKIYRSHKVIDEIRDKFIIDLSSTTTNYPMEIIVDFIKKFQLLHMVNVKDLLQVVFKKNVSKNTLRISGIDDILVDDIFHYCDIIHSAKAICTVFSGGCVLASSIRQFSDRPGIYCLVRNDFYNTGAYIFSNVRYHVF